MDADNNTVEVPETLCGLNDAQMLSLQALTLAKPDSDIYSIDLFRQILKEVERFSV